MRTLTFLSVIFILAITSCTKEARPVDQEPESGDSIYLSKVVVLRGGDTEAVKFYYDSQKRVIKDISVGSDSVTLNFNDYYFNGSERLPYKTFSRSLYGAVTDIFSFYNYENGRLVYDSTIRIEAFTSVDVKSFTYLNDSVQETILRGYPLFPNTYNRTMVNSNCVKQTDHDGLHTIIISYDTNPNPFYKVSDFQYPYLPLELTNWQITTKNNPTEIHETGLGIDYHTKYIYEYNSNGYPKSVTKINLITGENNGTSLLYYTSL